MTTRDKLIGECISKLHQRREELKEGLLLTQSWDSTIALQNRAHGIDEALNIIDQVLNDQE